MFFPGLELKKKQLEPTPRIFSKKGLLPLLP